VRTAGAHQASADQDRRWLELALRLARRGYGSTSPNPMVGAVIVRHGRLLGRGWHRKAGLPHAEIEALADARARGATPRGATLYVTLEPCSTRGRTPPCTRAILDAGIRRVVAAATDPNPAHAGRGFRLLEAAGIEVSHGLLGGIAADLNAPFNHWIVHRTPFVTLKAAMTLDGKIATRTGESRWITSPQARADAMRLRLGADAILVGIGTVLADDPSLTVRRPEAGGQRPEAGGQRSEVRGPTTEDGGQTTGQGRVVKVLPRVILDSRARTPLSARVVTDAWAGSTTVVVTRQAPARRVTALRERVRVVVAPRGPDGVDLDWLLGWLGRQDVTHAVVEGGGEVHGAFVRRGLVHRVVFYYAPCVVGGRDAPRAVAGVGAEGWSHVLRLESPRWRRVGPDLRLTADVAPAGD